MKRTFGKAGYSSSVFEPFLTCRGSGETDEEAERLSVYENKVPRKVLKGGFETMIKNLKKVISSAAAVAMLASSASAFALSFPDVDESASYASAVNTLAALGVINGDENGKFNPDNTVTRAEFTKMVVEALGEGDSATALTTSQFADAAGHWAVGYIAQGVAKGFINGYDETTFGPDDTVTYAQAVKMLVCAVGYDTYATQQGGWPSGYMAYGSSLKIINGVSGVNNDTALTRAQCAVLINNAMKAPLCVIDGYEYTGLMGTVAVPKLEVKDDKDGDYQTLLTEKHDAYVVKGRVTVTSKSGNLDAGEVKFQVEVADNFDDLTYGKNDASPVEETMLVGDTNAESLLFTYSEAVVQHDEDADEWTILAIEPYGSSKTVEFNADDVSDEEKNIGVDFIGSAKIPVYKSEGSTSTIKYDLADDVAIYVNGVRMAAGSADDDVKNDLLNTYLLNNPTGVVTLVDATEEGSTSTDGDYDYIMITCHRDAVVDSVTATSSSVKVYFKQYDASIDSKMTWDPEDEDLDIEFVLDGEEITYADLKEYDVLSIAYDESDAFSDSDYYEVVVSRNTVTGNVTSVDADDDEQTARIDGQDYEANTNMFDVEELELNTEYVLYLDAFGKVAYYDEGTTAKNYGVIVGMYTSAGNDYATVRMITGAGEVVAYECKDATEEANFYNIIKKANNNNANYNGETITKTEINTEVGVENAVVTYNLSGGKIRLKDTIAAKGADDLEFKASTSKLGSYAINDSVSKIIDMDAYLDGSDSTVGTLTTASFDDEGIYEAYLFDKNNDGDYRFIIVLKGTSSLRAEASLAVIRKNPGSTTIDGTDCYETVVARDGVEDTKLSIEKTSVTEGLNLKEGDVIVYTVGSEGYVEAGKITKVFAANSDYDTLLAKTLAKTNFSEMISDAVIDYANNKVKYGSDAASTDKDIELYFGIVAKKSGNTISLAKGMNAAKESSLDDETYVEDFTMDSDTNVYVYDYEKAKGNKVYIGQVPNTSKSFWNAAFKADDKGSKLDEDIIVWADAVDEEIEPNLALVKVVDDDVTEVVVFAAK